jgi:RHS repeat-associated protein
MATATAPRAHHPASTAARRGRAPAITPRGKNRPMGGLGFFDAEGAGGSSTFAQEKQRGSRVPDESVQRAPQFGFTGYITDDESGLLYARYRMYSPTLGRFVSRDPGEYIDGFSMYRAYFVPRATDPSGMYKDDGYKEETCDPPPPKKICGPDVTDWLIDEIKKNVPEAVGMRIDLPQNRWLLFLLNMKPKAKWDHKPLLSGATSADGTCPTNCPRTLTLCGECVNFDVPSNIHYGFIGKVADFSDTALTVAPGLVQEGGNWPHDDPVDTAAIQLGIDFYGMQKGQGINKVDLCAALKKAAAGLNKTGTEGCEPCAKPMKK